jgi:hypothetical protein
VQPLSNGQHCEAPGTSAIAWGMRADAGSDCGAKRVTLCVRIVEVDGGYEPRPCE